VATAAGLRLEFSDGGRLRGTLDNVNSVLTTVGASVSALNLEETPADVRRLLEKPSLSADENARVRDQFVLPRERLLQIIAEAGRQPHVAGGGELNTYVASHDYTYPQLYVASEAADYSRFDRFHVNTADDGTGTDEVLQLLWGAGFRVMLPIPTGGFLNAGWLVTYDGAGPHIGSLSHAQAGTKLLVQLIGPPKWRIRYLDEA
jgi:hypothetical protein